MRRFDRLDGSLMPAAVGIDDGAAMIGGGTTEFHTQRRISLFCAAAAVNQHEEVSNALWNLVAIGAWRASIKPHRSGSINECAS